MKIFFASKYPVGVGYEASKQITVPAGTIFTIHAITGNCFELSPIKKDPRIKNMIMVDAAMLDLGFTQQETIE